MKVHVQITEKGLRYASELAEAVFLDRCKGKYAYIVIDDTPTTQMRRYFEGAVVPAVYYQNPRSGWIDYGECREALKLEFLPLWVHQIRGSSAKTAKSTANLSKAQFTAFLEQVTGWMQEQGMEVPDPEEYKAWRDSAPAAGEVYPQLRRLKDQYNNQLTTQ